MITMPSAHRRLAVEQGDGRRAIARVFRLEGSHGNSLPFDY
jgi:hypothetical protein